MRDNDAGSSGAQSQAEETLRTVAALKRQLVYSAVLFSVALCVS